MSGGSRAGAWLMLRSALDEAIDYRANKRDFERGARHEYTLSGSDLEAMQGVITGDMPLLVNIHRASDIEVLLELLAEYGLRAIISGGAEAWMLADRLAAADVAVILAPMNILPSNFDRINSRRESAAMLAAAGVSISFADNNGTTHNAGNITQSAGNAVAYGLPYEDALRAITLAPAEIFGVADSLGSIEAGKEADVVIWPGDPLELTTFPEQVFIRGESVPMHSRQTLLRDRYLQMDSDKPPAYRR
jgi:imidazolonepropionase-like amidohydrolase